MSSDGDSILYPTLGFGAGIYLFIKGFREFRKYRLMADTPVIPIRSMAMGLVEIYGTARGEQLVSSPVSHTPCFWYRVQIEKRTKDSKGRESWSHFGTDVNGVSFYLEDATGKVRVDPMNAELDVKQQCKVERYGDTYIERVAAGTAVPHFIAATPPAAETGPRKELTSDEARREMELLPREMPLDRRAQQSAGVKALSLFRRLSTGGSSGRFRLTEYCIIPGQPYHISGTCAENPRPRDEHDRNIIRKGENEPTFHISWRTEKEVEKYLRRRSFKYILGGAALSVVCLGILLNEFGLF
jgi:hypothetical protein